MAWTHRGGASQASSSGILIFPQFLVWRWPAVVSLPPTNYKGVEWKVQNPVRTTKEEPEFGSILASVHLVFFDRDKWVANNAGESR